MRNLFQEMVDCKRKKKEEEEEKKGCDVIKSIWVEDFSTPPKIIGKNSFSRTRKDHTPLFSPPADLFTPNSLQNMTSLVKVHPIILSFLLEQPWTYKKCFPTLRPEFLLNSGRWCHLTKIFFPFFSLLYFFFLWDSQESRRFFFVYQLEFPPRKFFLAGTKSLAKVSATKIGKTNEASA